MRCAFVSWVIRIQAIFHLKNYPEGFIMTTMQALFDYQGKA